MIAFFKRDAALTRRRTSRPGCRADIAAVDDEPTVRADAHENACTGDIARVEDHWPVIELAKQGFDLAEPCVDLFGQFVRVFILGCRRRPGTRSRSASAAARR